jgi:hypothetical protein
MSKNLKITRDKQPKRNNDDVMKVRVINKAIKDMVKNGYITQQYADENRIKLVSAALKTLK